MELMPIELFRGPADGALVNVPGRTKLWIVEGLGEREPEAGDDEPVIINSYCYAHTGRSNGRGAWIFEYVGERVRK
jgi:hypothetical protein